MSDLERIKELEGDVERLQSGYALADKRATDNLHLAASYKLAEESAKNRAQKLEERVKELEGELAKMESAVASFCYGFEAAQTREQEWVHINELADLVSAEAMRNRRSPS